MQALEMSWSATTRGRTSTGAAVPAVAPTSGVSMVHLYVRLDRQGLGIIETGLDVPLGHMVVLGTAATRSASASSALTPFFFIVVST